MTCREKLAIEHPEKCSNEYAGGCGGCPHEYGYLVKPSDCEHRTCTSCWDREIPEEKKESALTRAGKAALQIAENCQKATEALVASNKILDSGDRTEFETGAVRDMREGKGRCDLMPLEVVRDLMDDPIIGYIANFLQDNDTSELYNCLDEFAHAFDNGKTKGSLTDIRFQQYCTMLLEVAKHFEEGAKKYGENNWQKGIPVKCYIDSAVRHYLKWLRGDKDEPHDRAFVWNLMCCIWEVDYHKEEPDD